jgi:cell division protein FtsW
MYFFRKQAIISAVCLVGAIGISMIDYHILTKLSLFIYIIAIGTMGVVPFIGKESHGAQRWIVIGPIQFQPAEIAKIAVIVCMSYMITHMGRKIKTLKACLVLLIIGAVPAFMAYKFTNNLSTALIIICITLAFIFIAHPALKRFLVMAGIGIVGAIAVVCYISNTFETSDSFRIRRILVWLHPENYSSGDGYQPLQALYAIGSGGIFGRGLGNSIQKQLVPEAQNDMIFSIICEELGIFGGLIVLILFAYLLYRLFFIAQNAPDMYGSLLVSGVFVHMALQVILNVSVVVGALPNTGVTLPFISYGGTSILFIMAEMGLVLSVARHIKFQDTGPLL